MHVMNYVLIGAVLLLLFGSKQLQSLARNAGKATGELRQAKDRLVADPSLEELMNMKRSLDRMPTTPGKAMQMMLAPTTKPADATNSTTNAVTEENV